MLTKALKLRTINLKPTVPDVTFDEELLCAIEICIQPSVHELRRWAELKVGLVIS